MSVPVGAQGEPDGWEAVPGAHPILDEFGEGMAEESGERCSMRAIGESEVEEGSLEARGGIEPPIMVPSFYPHLRLVM